MQNKRKHSYFLILFKTLLLVHELTYQDPILYFSPSHHFTICKYRFVLNTHHPFSIRFIAQNVTQGFLVFCNCGSAGWVIILLFFHKEPLRLHYKLYPFWYLIQGSARSSHLSVNSSLKTIIAWPRHFPRNTPWMFESSHRSCCCLTQPCLILPPLHSTFTLHQSLHYPYSSFKYSWDAPMVS